MDRPTAELSAPFRGRLRQRRQEIERAALSRVSAIAELSAEGDARYAEGLREAVAAAIDYGVAVIEGDCDVPVPVELLAQARLAARNGVSLDTVLRRYFSGYALLEQVVREEAAAELEENRPALMRLAREKAPAFERLVEEVTREYRRELAAAPDPSPERRRVARLKRLLAGDLVDSPELNYELDQRHVAAIGEGPGAISAMRELSRELGWTLLAAIDEGSVWAWFGTRRPRRSFRFGEAERFARGRSLVLALGEPGTGLAGWRQSHLQARAALAVARASSPGVCRYRQVALVAAAMQDEMLSASLRELFVLPLEQQGEGATLRETLRAYMAAERNISSAAAALGVSRHTVASRLRAIEERLGHPIGKCGASIEVALQLRDLETRE